MSRNRIIFVLASVLLFCGVVAVLYAQSPGKVAQSGTNRVDLRTQTWVGKRLVRTEDGADGQKIYHYQYRVEARQTAKSLPRYIVDRRYGISYETKGFKPGDSVTLLSTNPESETDSPIWVYNVIYVGSGTRQITFSTSGGATVPMFATVSGETDVCDCSNSNYSHGGGECNCGCAGLSCPCSCHVPVTCSGNCQCLQSDTCPGHDGHDCLNCNPCWFESACGHGCSQACSNSSCMCQCHFVVIVPPEVPEDEGCGTDTSCQ